MSCSSRIGDCKRFVHSKTRSWIDVLTRSCRTLARLVFCQTMSLHVACCIQQSEGAEQIGIFLKVVKQKVIERPNWSLSCFIINCVEAEVGALREVFPEIPIYFCSWHVRRYVFCHYNIFFIAISFFYSTSILIPRTFLIVIFFT